MIDAPTIISAVLSLGTLGVVFKAGAVVARVELSLSTLEKELETVGKGIEKLSTLDTLVVRVGNLESATAKITSEFPRANARLAVLEQRAASTDKFRAQATSRHDFGEEK